MCDNHPSHIDHRSHRWLGEQLDLFHFPAHSPGIPCWHPPGMQIWNALSDMWRELNVRHGYQEVRSPLLCDAQLWQRSGHWDKFRDRMFCLDVDGRDAALKPMNCPGHADLYAHRPRSYRELPLRIAEQGHVHRLEPSGSLNGLLRVRAFCQDDAHLFCRPDQVADEVLGCLQMAKDIYAMLGLRAHAELSLRPVQRLGDDRLWDHAEQVLRDSLHAAGLAFDERPGEGAFYGPKIDLHVSDSLGRAWQLGSVQLDYQMPERFDLRYVAEDGRDEDADGNPYRPVMVHRAMFGSFERFIGILIEHFDGQFPLWLAPQAVRVLPRGQGELGYAVDLGAQLERVGVRAGVACDGPLGKRIRDAEQQRVPVMLVVGPREMQDGSVSVRRRGRGNLGQQPRDRLVAQLAREVAERHR